MALEHSGVIQAAIEGLSFQQVLRRDELFQRYRGPGFTFEDATAVICGEKKLSDFGIDEDGTAQMDAA